MVNVIRADLYKIFKSTVIRVLLAITVLSSLIMVLFAYLIPKGSLGGEYTGIGFMFSDMNTISILGAVTAGIFICGDFENKTIHNTIADGYSRAGIIISKSIVFFCSILLIILPYAIVTILALSTGYKFEMGSVAIGFLNILSKQSGTELSAYVLVKLIAVSGTLIMVHMSQLSLCIPVAFAVKKPVLVVAIYYAISILSGQLSSLAARSSFNILSLTPFGGNRMFLTVQSGAGEILKGSAVSLLFIIVVVLVTCGIFRKSEIK
ncbi:ABC transporter permease [Ruminiclostridium cellulolyticum]|uniref:ABC-2 family transporter protein n=1 Tax=Ruminiclostridium cellulolyticum (strain ATCC 35319 / DSM 5812 / JCM 6584 / H10) TaxID=394503 RepID=B8I5C2_RUMCH|nr:ABC transporter permease [Ruminiclostridium cellulolyticum]ACL76658.1 hypothetical protein Ccel_2322 [Ruminiclostridium cellulolyticum H10]